MHDEDMVDTEAAQKRVEAILHEPAKPPRKRRSDAGTPRAKKAQEQPVQAQGVLTKEQAEEIKAIWNETLLAADDEHRKRDEWQESLIALNRLKDKMGARLDSLTARKEG